MKPPQFEYDAPHTIADALSQLQTWGGEAKLLAGGQSLLPLLNLRLARPTRLVDINRLPDLSHIRLSTQGDLVIGGIARLRVIEGSEVVRDQWPLLAEAIPNIGHVAIRNRGTIGGSLAHADPAAELPAVMVALDAKFTVQSALGKRVIEAGEFFVGPFTTSIQPDEMLVEINMPPMKSRTGHSFQEVSRRQGDFGLAAVAALVRLDAAGIIADARLVFAGLGPAVSRATAAESSLIGVRPETKIFESAARQSSALLTPTSDIHGTSSFRRHLAGVLAFRALESATARAAQGA